MVRIVASAPHTAAPWARLASRPDDVVVAAAGRLFAITRDVGALSVMSCETGALVSRSVTWSR